MAMIDAAVEAEEHISELHGKLKDMLAEVELAKSKGRSLWDKCRELEKENARLLQAARDSEAYARRVWDDKEAVIEKLRADNARLTQPLGFAAADCEGCPRD